MRVMPEIAVTVVGIADEAFPGFVVCALIDAHGQDDLHRGYND
jgi:hypothetical protein